MNRIWLEYAILFYGLNLISYGLNNSIKILTYRVDSFIIMWGWLFLSHFTAPDQVYFIQCKHGYIFFLLDSICMQYHFNPFPVMRSASINSEEFLLAVYFATLPPIVQCSLLPSWFSSLKTNSLLRSSIQRKCLALLIKYTHHSYHPVK